MVKQTAMVGKGLTYNLLYSRGIVEDVDNPYHLSQHAPKAQGIAQRSEP